MAGNRYYATAPQEVFESYEWSFKEALTNMDRMARNLDYDLYIAGIPTKDRPALIQQFLRTCGSKWLQRKKSRTAKANQNI